MNQYTKIFAPSEMLQDFRTPQDDLTSQWADRRDGRLYLYNDEIILAVNVALATGRPLLVRGQSGSGKSALAYNIARVMNRRYYEQVITARTQARDLLWRFDAVRRLGDAQAQAHGAENIPLSHTYYPYIEPGVLWWVFDRNSAEYRGLPADQKHKEFTTATDRAIYIPKNQKNEPDYNAPAVVLIDEIDKADPDVPNNLLVPLGSLKFIVEETQTEVEFKTPHGEPPQPDELPLLIITTNEERQLPNAFLRRCVVLTIPSPDKDRLLAIAKWTEGADAIQLYKDIYEAMARSMLDRGIKKPEISIAEYLDTVRACLQLEIQGKSELVDQIINKTLWKAIDVRGGQ